MSARYCTKTSHVQDGAVQDIAQRIVQHIARRPVTLDPALPPCPLCGAGALAGGDFSTPERIEHNCDCLYREEERYSAALRKAWKRWWRPRVYREGLPPVYQGYLDRPWEGGKAVQQQLSRWKEEGRILYLYGTPGTGKTHLAVRMGGWMAAEGKRVRFFSEGEFYDQARKETLEPGGVQLLEQVDGVVLDDLGKARLTPFAAELLFRVVEAAHTGRLRLVITAQLPPAEAARKLGENAEALLSRIDCALEIRGADRRRKEKSPGPAPGVLGGEQPAASG